MGETHDKKTLIPVNRPMIYPETKRVLAACAESGWLSSEGPYVRQFEKRFARFIGVPFATTTSSGTAALHLAVASLGIGHGDEVIVPASTIASCYFAVWYTGATAVPVDVDPETYTVNPGRIEASVTEKTKAIMVVHLFGHPCDMDKIAAIAKKHGLSIIEDAAEAHGARYKGRMVGGLGDVAIFSFYANKLITTGEGGMLVTASRQIYERAVALKSLNHSPVRFVHNGIGYNYLMSNLQAAAGIVGLKHIRASIRRKRAIASFYHRRLQNIPGIILPTEKNWATSVFWMYAVLIRHRLFGTDRQHLMHLLKERYNIQTRTFFYPPNIAFAASRIYQHQSFPVSERIAEEGLYLPSGVGTANAELSAVCAALRRISDESRPHTPRSCNRKQKPV